VRHVLRFECTGYFITGPKGERVRVCAACGHKNTEEGEHRCARCGRRLDRLAPARALEPTPPLPARPVSTGAGAAAAPAPEWRRQVSERFEQFQQKRAQQQGSFVEGRGREGPEEVPRPAPGQKIVSFDDFAAHRIEPLIVEPREPARPGAGESAAGGASLGTEIFPLEDLTPDPVASLLARGMAGALDLALTTAALGTFLGTFHLLGGALDFNQRAATGLGLAAAILIAFYVFLYTFYTAETPGMRWMGLCVRDFEGRPPQPEQRLARALGALLSAAALGLGYLWALADEDALTWHDRMSRTLVTRDPQGRNASRGNPV